MEKIVTKDMNVTGDFVGNVVRGSDLVIAACGAGDRERALDLFAELKETQGIASRTSRGGGDRAVSDRAFAKAESVAVLLCARRAARERIAA